MDVDNRRQITLFYKFSSFIWIFNEKSGHHVSATYIYWTLLSFFCHLLIGFMFIVTQRSTRSNERIWSAQAVWCLSAYAAIKRKWSRRTACVIYSWRNCFKNILRLKYDMNVYIICMWHLKTINSKFCRFMNTNFDWRTVYCQTRLLDWRNNALWGYRFSFSK